MKKKNEERHFCFAEGLIYRCRILSLRSSIILNFMFDEIAIRKAEICVCVCVCVWITDFPQFHRNVVVPILFSSIFIEIDYPNRHDAPILMSLRLFRRSFPSLSALSAVGCSLLKRFLNRTLNFWIIFLVFFFLFFALLGYLFNNLLDRRHPKDGCRGDIGCDQTMECNWITRCECELRGTLVMKAMFWCDESWFSMRMHWSASGALILQRFQCMHAGQRRDQQHSSNLPKAEFQNNFFSQNLFDAQKQYI